MRCLHDTIYIPEGKGNKVMIILLWKGKVGYDPAVGMKNNITRYCPLRKAVFEGNKVCSGTL